MAGRLTRNTSVYSVGEILTRLVAFGLVPVYTLFLPPEELAVWGLGAMGLQLGTVIYGLGLQAGLVQFQYDYLDDEAGRRAFNGSILGFLLVWPVLLHLGLELAAPPLLEAFLPELPWSPYGRLLSLAALAGTMTVVPVAMWTSGERPKPYVLLGFSRSVVEAGLIVVLMVAFGAGVLSIFIGKLAGAALLALPLLVYTLRHADLGLRREHLVPALAFAVPLLPHLLSNWALTMADRVLLVALDSRAALGMYTAAYWFPMAVNLLAQSGNRAWSPTFHKQINEPDRREALRSSTTWFAIAILTVAVGGASVAPDAVRLLFNARYHDAAGFVRLLALGAGFQGLYYIFVAALYRHKRRFAIPAATLLAAGLNIALNLAWIPDHGAAGAAAATLVSYAALSGLVYLFGRRSGVPFDRARMVRALVTLAVGFALAEVAGELVPALGSTAVDAAARLGVRGAVFTAVFAAVFGRAGLSMLRGGP